MGLRGLLEQRERILDEQRSKALLPTDTDMLRTKIAREIEAPYKLRIEALTQDVEKLEEKQREVERENKLLKGELEDREARWSKEMSDLRTKHQGEVKSLTNELHLLREQLDEVKDKELIRTLRREVEEYKRRSLDAQRDAGDLRRQRDELKLQRTTIAIEHAKQIDQVKTHEVKALNDLEDQKLELQKVKEELKGELQASSELRQQVQQLIVNNSSLKEKLRESELEFSQYLAHYGNVEEQLKVKEASLNEYSRKIKEEHKEQTIHDRQEKTKLQQEIERLGKELIQYRDGRRQEYQDMASKYETTLHERNAFQDECKASRKRLADLQCSFENLKQNYVRMFDAKDKLEKEVNRCQERYRSLLNKENELATAKTHLEFSVKAIEGNCQQLNNEKISWDTERMQLQRQIAELTQKLEGETKRTKEEVLRYKRKASDYKGKVKEANMKLQQMAAKLSRIQTDTFVSTRAAPEVIARPTIVEPLDDVGQLESEINATLSRHKGGS
eukprot:TRINITY_DN14602_c0_g2_i1.p1 TRINITY_DN14602_c0_g2~~TRINITY_DN14602_c0_g2_i1.p1  ORF type:complete len:503 (+),score=183.64 TRINITY_DN14602_c0_g2_i1:81-1589(+)